jgi:hypothetical protein
LVLLMSCTSYPFANRVAQEMPVVSADAHMQRLVKAHAVDVALSSSALVALVDNHAPSFAEPWILPVRIVATADSGALCV